MLTLTLLLRRQIQCLAAFLALASLFLPVIPAAPVARAAAAATPAPTEHNAHLAEMLGRLPFLPLGTNEFLDIERAMVIYADFALQMEALGVDPPHGIADVEGVRRWVKAVGALLLPHTLADWRQPEWRQQFGFDMFQVDQAVEYADPHGSMILVLRGRFDDEELRAAWAHRGYERVDLGVGESYALPEDHEIDFSNPADRMVGSSMNVVAIAGDGSLIYGRTREGVRLALGATAGEFPSFIDRAEIAPLVRAAPTELTSALLVGGEELRAPSEAELVQYPGETPETFAARLAAEQAEAERLPLVMAALLGQTTSTPSRGEATPPPGMLAPDQLVIALAMPTDQAAEIAAAVIAERLATQTLPAGLGESRTGLTWAEFFPERAVRAVPGRAVLIEFKQIPATRLLFLKDSMIFSGVPGFLGWNESD